MPSSFDPLADLYDSLIDWPKRLAYETPFFRTLFEQHNVHTLADVACGTGHHAHLFHSWGLAVHASDLSPTMIARAQSTFPPSPTLRWEAKSFTDPFALPNTYDAVLCLGNSLPLVPELDAVSRALSHMLAATRSGGLVILHLLNLHRFPVGPITWQKTLRRTLPTYGDATLFKGIHRTPTHGYVNLLVAPTDPTVPPFTHAGPLLLLDQPGLTDLATRHGAATVTAYGNHEFQPYNPATSPDLILVATKP